jgi:sigma-E factor negative regulatory protein RseC
MQQAIAEILSVSGRDATVAVAASVCARCAAGKGCGAGLLGAAARRRRFTVPVPEGCELRPGDRVSLMLAPRHLLRASLMVYGLPLAALVTVPGFANWWWGPLSDLSLSALALLAVAATVVAVRCRLRRDDCLQRFVPSIAARLAPGGVVD